MPSLSKKTVKEIHQAILASNSLNAAAKRLKVKSPTLSKHLGKFTYRDKNNSTQTLSYVAMKTEWPNETAGEQAWGEAYAQLMIAVKPDLAKKTLREIHQAIIASSSLNAAANRLGVSGPQLNMHLGKFTYRDNNEITQTLSYDAMITVWPNETAGEQAWLTAYDRPMGTAKTNLAKKTMREIHQAILTTNSLDAAANRLGVSGSKLSRHLGKFTYMDNNGNTPPLSYDAMKTVWPNATAGQQAWLAAYDQPMVAVKSDLAKKTLREIHQAILTTNSLDAAAGRLGVTRPVLRTYLGNFTYIDNNDSTEQLSYDAMKTEWPNVEAGESGWGKAYDQPLGTPKGTVKPLGTVKIDLAKKTLREIHQAILASDSLAAAANRLGVSGDKLSRYLGRFTYIDNNDSTQPLSYDAMRTVWPNETDGQQAWLATYDQPMGTAKSNLAKKTFREIHQAILATNSLEAAASRLGVTRPILRTYLGKFTYIDNNYSTEQLSYDAMKTEWPSETDGQYAWGEAYDQPLGNVKIDLGKKTLREIHQAILASDSLAVAANRLGVSGPQLSMHLAKVTYMDNVGNTPPLSYIAMKTVWPNETDGQYAWGEAYDQPMDSVKIDLVEKTLREIHQAILASDSLAAAANRLGVWGNKLSMHLGKFTYIDNNGNTPPLSYDVMKTVWPNETDGQYAWGEAYDQPMGTVKIDLSKKTFREIHQAILATNSLESAANRLGVSGAELSKHLENFTYKGNNSNTQPLSYDVMKTVLPNETDGQYTWGEAYDQPMNQSVNIEANSSQNTIPSKKLSITLGDFHEALASSETTLDAVEYINSKFQDKLNSGIDESDIALWLFDLRITFLNLQSMSSSELQNRFGDQNTLLSDYFPNVAQLFPSLASKKRQSDGVQEDEELYKTLKNVAYIINNTDSVEAAASELDTSAELLEKALDEIGLNYVDIKTETNNYSSRKDLDDIIQIRIMITDSSSKRQNCG